MQRTLPTIFLKKRATVKEIYRISRKNRLNPIRFWETKWATVLKKNENDLKFENYTQVKSKL